MDFGLMMFILFILGIVSLDVSMVVSLIKKNDERQQMIIWKASTYTLLIVVLTLIGDVLRNLFSNSYTGTNPLTFLTVVAIIYFITLLYYKKKYGN
ncbi:hypothetical protein [Vagococcus bubulae]|nr:hypothetical protein [Vagococcus bubulae]